MLRKNNHVACIHWWPKGILHTSMLWFSITEGWLSGKPAADFPWLCLRNHSWQTSLLTTLYAVGSKTQHIHDWLDICAHLFTLYHEESDTFLCHSHWWQNMDPPSCATEQIPIYTMETPYIPISKRHSNLSQWQGMWCSHFLGTLKYQFFSVIMNQEWW
jgi:hypothetical protein